MECLSSNVRAMDYPVGGVQCNIKGQAVSDAGLVKRHVVAQQLGVKETVEDIIIGRGDRGLMLIISNGIAWR